MLRACKFLLSLKGITAIVTLIQFLLIQISCSSPSAKWCVGTDFRGWRRFHDLSKYPVTCTGYYQDRYNSCTHIAGNLEIFSIDEDISFIKDIQEITGYLLIHKVHFFHLIFSRLKIIRGQSLFRLTQNDRGYSLLTMDSDLDLLMFPALREISRGNVGVYTKNKRMCYLETINWKNILEEEGAQFDYFPEFDGRKNAKIYKPKSDTRPSGENECNDCHANCKEGCWGPRSDQCQEFFKLDCTIQCFGGQCYEPTTSATSAQQCCHQLCAAGCNGPTASECISCKHVYYGGECKEKCPPGKLSFGTSCEDVCPENAFLDEEEQACLSDCPDDKIHVEGKCKRLSPSEKKCKQPSPIWAYIHSGNIDQFQNCTIFEGDIVIDKDTYPGTYKFHHNLTFRSQQAPLHPSKLEVFSTLTEIKGTLQVKGPFPPSYSGSLSLTAFKNLEIIGTYKIPCKYNFEWESLTIMDTPFEKVQLGSLREVRGPVNIVSNKRLCYVNSVNWAALTSSSKISNVNVKVNGGTVECEGRNCSDQCSTNGCFGGEQEDCVCLEFRVNGRCLKSCSEKDGYVANGKSCIKACPVGEYEEGGACKRCHEYCQGGCTGPQSRLGDLGCNSCQLAVFIDDNTFDCMGKEDRCATGQFSTTVNIREKSIVNLRVCKPCHHLCRRCTDYGITEEICQECTHYWSSGICVETCPVDFYTDKANKQCLPCQGEHKKCTGGDLKNCKNCKLQLNESYYDSHTCVLDCSSAPPEMSPPLESEKLEETTLTPEAEIPASTNTQLTLLIGIAVAAIFSTILILFGIKMCFCKNQRNYKEESLPLADRITSNIPTVFGEDLRRQELLGVGPYGKVYSGIWIRQDAKQETFVALKILEGKFGAKSKPFADIAQRIAGLDHPNILQLLSFSISTAEIILVTPMMALGCLQNCLRNSKGFIDPSTMLSWCIQIAKGMDYLQSCHVVHGNLTARNVLMESSNSLKISDIGITNMLKFAEGQCKEEKLPVQWLAPEWFRTRTFSHESDVWAFGVTIWEILTYGENPYEGVLPENMKSILENGQRLEQPQICSRELWAALNETWSSEPEHRPLFSEIADRLSGMRRNSGYHINIPGDKNLRFPHYPGIIKM